MATEVQTAPVTLIEPEGPSALEYLDVLRRRKKTIIVPAILCAILGGVVAILLPERYEASTKFRVDDPQLMRDALGGGVPVPPHKPLLYRAESEIKSPRFLGPIIGRVGLSEGYVVNDPQDYTRLLDYVGDHLTVRIDKAQQGPDIIEVSYEGRDQAKVVDFVREIRKTYDTYFLAQFRERVRDWYQSARNEVEVRARNVTEQEAANKAFLESDERRLLGNMRLLEAEVEGLQEDERKLATEIKELITEESALRVQMAGVDPMQRSRRAVTNPELVAVQELYKTATEVLDRMIVVNGLTESNADRIAQQKKVDALRTRLQEVAKADYLNEETPNPLYQELESKAFSLKRIAEAKQKSLVDVRDRLARAREDLRQAPEVANRAEVLSAALENARTQREIADRHFGRAKATWEQVRDANLFRTLDESVGNEPPVFPNPILFVLIGAAAGLMLGMGVAFLREFSGMTYASTAQVRSVVPLPVLGEVARIETEAAEARADAGRKGFWIALAILLVVIGVIHVMYFDDGLSAHLPGSLLDLMDAIYAGG